MGYSNKELDALYEKIKKEVDDQKVGTLAKEIGTIIQDEAPWIKCFARDDMVVMSSALEGFETVDAGINMYTLKWK